ncbi:heavy-metal-associated domain-containing protein [Streptomyces diacarni]
MRTPYGQAVRTRRTENEESAMSTVTTTYKVSGMTCGHCEGAVSEEISRIEGVSAVQAQAASGQVAVTSTGELDDAAVRDAVDEAGYELIGRA